MSPRKKLVGIILIAFNLIWLLLLPFIGFGEFVQQRFRPANSIEAPFLDDLSADTVLVFWGYVGCSTVCPISLSTLNTIYQTYQAEYPPASLEVIFVGLPLPGEHSSSEAVERYAQVFNENFKGYSLAGQELSRSGRAFGVIKSVSPSDPEAMLHSSSIYLLRRNNHGWQIEHTYREYPPQQTQILHDLRRLVNQGESAPGDTASLTN